MTGQMGHQVPIDVAAIERTCDIADGVAARALAGQAIPTDEQVDALRDLLHGHLRLVAADVRVQYRDSGSMGLPGLVAAVLTLVEGLVDAPERRGVLDLLAPPAAIRLLLTLWVTSVRR
ncbi:hypothetical protein [Streptomyces sp. NPDC052179]|uniref:hypothetical protein n=1 Tax=Streptomyces sp. NPDC052179 TaxID=3155680 RepID=UPI003441892B